MRAIFSVGLMGLGLMVWTSSGAYSQSGTVPKFEVASVRPSKSGSGHSSENQTNGRFTATNVTLKDCIKFAYGLKDYQISGPAWLNDERYDIVAKAADGAATDQLMPMLQTLLTDRFRLTIHREHKELPIYALVMGKNGSKLHEVELYCRRGRLDPPSRLHLRARSRRDAAWDRTGRVNR